MKHIEDSRNKMLFNFVSTIVGGNDSIVRQTLAMLWITNVASKEARDFLDILVELCIVRRKLIFAERPERLC